MTTGQERAAVGDRPRQAARVRQNRALGALLSLYGWIARVVGAVSGADAYVALRNGRARHGWFVVVVEFVVMTVFLGSGWWAIRQGHRHRAPVLPSLGEPARDTGPIVLFLRSFTDDEGFARVPRGPTRGPWAATSRTEEQQLARAVAPFGPLVALGRPEDTLPQAGAGRHYSSDLQWQEQVLAGLERSVLVLLACGPGLSLRWEVEQVLARVRPERLVLITARDAQQYESFRAANEDLFPKGLPAWPAGHGRLSSLYTLGAVWFDADWTPHAVALGDEDPEIDVHKLIARARLVESAFPLAIRPVYLRAGVEVPGLPDGPVPRPPAVHVGIILYAAVWATLFAALLHRGDSATVLVFVLLPNALLLYGTWRGSPVAVNFLRFMGGALGLIVLLLWALLPDRGDHAYTSAVVPLLLGAGLVLSVLLLSRRDVRRWLAARAYRQLVQRPEAVTA
ncbi:hypothetical protein ACFZAR_19645 [Streptomyces sp. NPDC008222]|uniref:hypothetical protein n=1 Tax=Streptomyces sp. NPDC008222 TaxID=3364820 RepID=UPI0036ED9CD0